MTHDEAIELIQAQQGGKTIEEFINGQWHSLRQWYSLPNLDALLISLQRNIPIRIKPEPVIVRGWVNVYDNGNVFAHRTKDETEEAHYPRPRIARLKVEYEEGQFDE